MQCRQSRLCSSPDWPPPLAGLPGVPSLHHSYHPALQRPRPRSSGGQVPTLGDGLRPQEAQGLRAPRRRPRSAGRVSNWILRTDRQEEASKENRGRGSWQGGGQSKDGGWQGATPEVRWDADCAGSPCLLVPRTLTQEDPGDNQITLEEITQMVSRACPQRPAPALWLPGSPPPGPPNRAQSPSPHPALRAAVQGRCPGPTRAACDPLGPDAR